MRITHIISIIFACVILYACSGKLTKFDDWDSFQDYLNYSKNGFILENKDGDFFYEVKITPPTNESNKSITINLRINHLDGSAVLNTNRFSEIEIMQIENYLSFEIENDLVLAKSNSKISPSLVHYERNYRLKPSIDIIIDFNNIKQGEDYVFVYRDRIFSKETIEFQINQELLNVCHVKKT